MITIRGSGDCERAEAQAARLRNIAKVIEHDINHWIDHLDPVAVEEARARIGRHRAEAAEWDRLVDDFRQEPVRVLPAHFAEAGDELGHRVGG